MKKVTLIIGLIAIVLIALAGYRGGAPMVYQGLKHSIESFMLVSPLLVLAFGVTGLLQGLLKKEAIKNLLGREAGFKGILLGAVAGAIMPGGPYIAFPIIGAVFKAGAGLGQVVTMVTAWSTMSVGLIIFELAFLGPRFTMARMAVMFWTPVVAGILAQLFF